jgi:hypothetical protein
MVKMGVWEGHFPTIDGRGEDSNLPPLGPKPIIRQKRKYLTFRKLQPPKKIKDFYIPSYPLPSHIGSLLLFLVNYWPVGTLYH